MFLWGTLQSWNKPNKERLVADSTFDSEQLFLPVLVTEFELPFKKIWLAV